jgi:hypothetical protein
VNKNQLLNNKTKEAFLPAMGCSRNSQPDVFLDRCCWHSLEQYHCCQGQLEPCQENDVQALQGPPGEALELSQVTITRHVTLFWNWKVYALL